MPGYRWSESDVSELRQMNKVGKPINDMAIMLDRSPSAVRRKLEHMGIYRDPEWSDADEDLARSLYLGFRTIPYISGALRKAPSQVVALIKRRRWEKEKRALMRGMRDAEHSNKPWAPEDDIKLELMYHNGAEVFYIAYALGRSEVSIRKRLNKQGIVRNEEVSVA